MTFSTEAETIGFKPKKSVALSGVTAGNTALCSVGRTGNDLHYRGYDILDIAEVCEFEEVAHLLVHGALPTAAELRAYKARLKAMRGVPASVKLALEQIPANAHPMDVMRTGVSALGCTQPSAETALRITSIGWALAGRFSSTDLTAAGTPRRDLSLAL